MAQSIGNVNFPVGGKSEIQGDAFVNKTMTNFGGQPTTSMDTQAERPNLEEGQELFHKEADDSVLYDYLKPYFKADVNKSIGVIEIKDKKHGTCFRVGSKFVMTAYHVIGGNALETCSVKFEEDTQEYGISDCGFDDELKDIIILELKVDDPNTLPKPLELNVQLHSKVNIFGYPSEKRLRIDIGCPVYIDDRALEKDSVEALKYWNEKYPEKNFRGSFDILKSRTALHSSRMFEHGASGSPLFRLEGDKPVVTMMYQGGTPRTYYEDREVQKRNHPMKHRFEYGISIKDIREVLQKKRRIRVIEDIFKN